MYSIPYLEMQKASKDGGGEPRSWVVKLLLDCQYLYQIVWESKTWKSIPDDKEGRRRSKVSTTAKHMQK